MATDTFAPVRQAAELMRGFAPPWSVAGGWAIDLFVGRVTRDHGDVEIAILRRDQRDLRRHLSAWTFERVVPGEHRLEPWREDEWLEPPCHEVHARRETGELRHVEILLNESEGGLWRFRRHPRIARPLDDIALASGDGIPYLAPEIVLLYKGKGTQSRDEADFDVAWPLMDRGQREWLGYALRECHPGHPWLSRL